MIVRVCVVYVCTVGHDSQSYPCVAVCCSVLQCVAVCCSVLQCVAVCCSVLQCVAVCCGESQVCCQAHCFHSCDLCFIIQREIRNVVRFTIPREIKRIISFVFP